MESSNLETVPTLKDGHYYKLCICETSFSSEKNISGKTKFGDNSQNFDDFFVRPIFGKYENGKMEEILTSTELPHVSKVKIKKNYVDNKYYCSNPCYLYAIETTEEEVKHFLKMIQINLDEAINCYINPLENYFKDIEDKYEQIQETPPSVEDLLKKVRKKILEKKSR